ncbi:MAG: hypothetical protein AAGM21_16175 [Pseudomonadota bacterium]
MKHDDIPWPILRLIALVVAAAALTIALAAALSGPIFGANLWGNTNVGTGGAVALLVAALALGWWSRR